MFYFLITAKKGAERLACLEALDIVYSLGITGRCHLTRFEGVLLLELGPGLFSFYEMALKAPISSAKRLVPLVGEDAFLARWTLFEGSIRPKCVKRGKADCGAILAHLNKHNPRATYIYASLADRILHVETVDDFVGFFILPRGCDAYPRAVFLQRLGKRCLDAIRNEEKLLLEASGGARSGRL